MAPKEDVNDIVQNFVDNDLASLDRIGGESDSFSLSPHLAQRSPDLNSQQGQTTSKQGPQIQSGSKDALTGPSGGTTSRTSSGQPGNSSSEHPRPSAASSDSTGADAPPSTAKSRHVSTSSTTSASTLDREKRASLGDKFKKFGKRIASGSKK